MTVMRSRILKTDTEIDTSWAPYGACLLRLALSTMWLSHAGLKFFTFTLPGFAQFLIDVNLPPFLAWPIFLGETIGGLAILLGFYGRQFSLILLPILAGAAWVHWPNGWDHTSPGGGWEYPVFLIAASLAHAFIGEGAWALRPSRLFFDT